MMSLLEIFARYCIKIFHNFFSKVTKVYLSELPAFTDDRYTRNTAHGDHGKFQEQKHCKLSYLITLVQQQHSVPDENIPFSYQRHLD